MPSGLPPLPSWAWLLVASATVMALAGSGLLRRRPLPALGLLIAGSLAMALAMDTLGIAVLHFLAIDVALGFIVATRSRRTGIVALVMTLGVLPGYTITRSLFGLPLAVVPGGIAGGVWQTWQLFASTAVIAGLIGNSIRQVRQYTERLQAQAAAQAVTAERLRIARELHDMVAHSIGIIALQSGAAVRVIDTQPARARQAMIAVETTGRETLTGLRRILGALRQTEPAQELQTAPLHPAPDLADVDRLAAITTAAGVRVDVRRRGERRPLPPDIDLSAYRIIQESITNVVRHAATHSCQVSIDYRDKELAIEIADSGQGCDTITGTGYGLLGLRERVALLRGDFTAEPRPEGGFRVTARLPLPAPVGAE